MTLATTWVRLIALGAASAMTAMASPVAVSAKGYAELDKLPAWSNGVWYPSFGRRPGPAGPPKPPAYTPEAAKMIADYNAKRKEGENLQTDDANCIPPGMPRMMQMPYPVEFLFTPGRVTILTEAYMQVRRIYTDGRKLPDDPDPQFNGNSIGHWEGDTLVVDTVGLEPRTTLMAAIHPTEQTKIHERFHIDPTSKNLIDDIEISDPSIFTETYHTQLSFASRPDWSIREYVCEENNHDAADPFGRPSMSLGNEKQN